MLQNMRGITYNNGVQGSVTELTQHSVPEGVAELIQYSMQGSESRIRLRPHARTRSETGSQLGVWQK